MPAFIDLAGKRFGTLVVLERAENNKHNHVCWRCLCDCGNVVVVLGSNLAAGLTKSCGCSRSRHGCTDTPEYRSWDAMNQRCDNPNNPSYYLYGGRGIKICERWEVFENFLVDMGPRPSGHSLHRIDSNKDYEPSNCRWATPKEQAEGRRPKSEWTGSVGPIFNLRELR